MMASVCVRMVGVVMTAVSSIYCLSKIFTVPTKQKST